MGSFHLHSIAGRDRLRRLLVAFGMLALGWSLFLQATGGFDVRTSLGRLASHDPWRPLIIGVVIAVVYAWRWRRHGREDLIAASRVDWPRAIAVLTTAAALGIGLHWGTTVAGGPDASGYVSESRMWMRGALTIHAPAWVDGARWNNAAWSSSPSGYRPTETSPILVPMYAPGLPMVMALFQLLAGPDAWMWVIPTFGAVAIWFTYRLGQQVVHAWAGATASLLMLTSPILLVMTVQPMSDVPVTACWTCAMAAAWGAGRRSAILAGIAAALAILIRPNTAPLAAVVVLVAAAGVQPRTRALLITWAIVPAILFIGILHTHWYGSPLRTGYGRAEHLYAASYVWTNLRYHWRALVQTESLLFGIVLLAPLVAWRAGARARTLLVVALFPMAVLSLYVAYLPFPEWEYQRFLLPAFPALFVGLTAAIATAARTHRRAAIVAGTLFAGCLITYTTTSAYATVAFEFRDLDARYARAATYARSLPENAILVSTNHSGTLRMDAGRDVLRWEIVEPHEIDLAADYLRGLGHPLFFVGDRGEVPLFMARFAGSRAAAELERAVPVADLQGAVVYAMTGSR